ncbi:unnamed protein product [Medioppia subpectinata]|uniref:MD-2-related lipid-recognition domain-containing protein n=1 Tax=Medioppia subpectinata TaxID=1979941 RepID=A0A7R9Q4H2_9ACAR|nr:unnamed protein product [Medioppia subpectinata]CAG2112296.1 unnamed protein product [Medioppia subpectinata]
MGQYGGITNSIDINGCDNNQTCKISAYHNVSITIDYILDQDISEPTYSAILTWSPKPGIVNGDIFTMAANACAHTPCPIRKGVAQRLTINPAPHESVYTTGSALNALLKLTIEDKGRTYALCSYMCIYCLNIFRFLNYKIISGRADGKDCGSDRPILLGVMIPDIIANTRRNVGSLPHR